MKVWIEQMGSSDRSVDMWRKGEAMSKLFRRLITAVVLLCFVTVSTACYGPFTLTKNVYHWNSNIRGSGQVNNKWMKEIVFFGMLIVPAYMFSALLDTFIFNSMHFWTGESPIKGSHLGNSGDTKVTMMGDTVIRWVSADDGAKVVYERQGVIQHRATIVANAAGYRLIDEDGKILSEAEYATDGSVSFRDGDGRLVNRWSKKQLQSMAHPHPIPLPVE
jgi:hypothetical protein